MVEITSIVHYLVREKSIPSKVPVPLSSLDTVLKCNSTFKIKKDMLESSMSPFSGHLDYNCTPQIDWDIQVCILQNAANSLPQLVHGGTILELIRDRKWHHTATCRLKLWSSPELNTLAHALISIWFVSQCVPVYSRGIPGSVLQKQWGKETCSKRVMDEL